MSVDLHIHALAHGQYDYSREWLGKFLAKAQQQGIVEVGFSEHEEMASQVDEANLRLVSSDYPGIAVRLGLEMDYKPGREREIRGIIKKRAYDFVIGSVHHIGEWPFDHPDYRYGFASRDIDKLYENYYRLVVQAAKSRLFDIIGHLDLIKIWGHRPVNCAEEDFIRPFLEEVRRAGVAVEINTAGLRKPVQEIYPSERLITVLFNADIPVTFGSDAHHPDEVGQYLALAREIARRAGYRVCTCFRGRRPFPVTIDA